MTKLQKLRNSAITLAGTTLYGIHTVMAQGSGFINATDNPSRVAGATGGQASLRAFILTLVNFFLGFLGLIAVLIVIYGGVMVITSQGDVEKAGKGKKMLTFAAIGIVIVLMSFAFVSTILGAGTGQDA